MRTKIRTKLIGVTSIILCISLLLSGFFTYYYVTRIIREQSIQDSLIKLSQNALQLRRIQEQTREIAEYIIVDSEIQNLIQQETPLDMEESYFHKLDVQERLKKFTALNDYIMNIVIIRSDGEVFSNKSGYAEYFSSYQEQPWFRQMRVPDSGMRFSVSHESYFVNRLHPAISYVVPYKRIGEEEPAAVNTLIIDIKYNQLVSTMEQSLGNYDRIMLLNRLGQTLYDSDKGEIPAQALQLPEDGQELPEWEENADYLNIYNRSMLEDWVQVAVISKDKLFAKLKSILVFYVLILTFSLILTLSLMLPFVSRMIRPLSRMVSAMRRVSEGDLSSQVSIKSGDELEILGDGFNRMVKQLQEHVQLSVENEEAKRDMQVKLLMAQINPHFIYNTLNSVIYLSHANRSSEAVDITRSLIGLLQESIHRGDHAFFSTLGEEIRIANRYIDIQAIRYPERFQVIWEIEEGLEQAQMPKMILQPIIENALFHGICSEYRTELGYIRISAQRADDSMELTIADNGKGMQPEQLQRLASMQGKQKSSSENQGIGLANIRERIHYHYGKHYDLTIASGPGQGTRVTVRIPLQPAKL
ncbi:cache domain-containing sensor histidine kinase [Paenibacillus nasutitermitis]|uniref:histidine kinase n=1 Tax=Paenibacillus nasutitermitis TaxID=1652958 RepID=A0A916YR72_9BACL|nr:sensor histidine kinase [Paenibacillus nasutitermitis]GGD56191.1 histidine kinase [Paenibacillus nasutitermitis]